MRYYACLIACIALLLSVAPTRADEPKPAKITLAGAGLPIGKVLTDQQRRQAYLALIENFIGWTESGGRFHSDDSIEPGGGSFAGQGAGVSWARGNSDLLVAYAVLLTAEPKRREFTACHIPRAQLMDHLRRSIRAVCLTNTNCSRATSKRWGGPSWQAALELTGTAWAAHLMERELDPDTLSLVREVVCKEADNLDRPIPSMRPGDTGSEDCSWNAPLPALAACKYADDPRAPKWDRLAKRWAINGVSTQFDRASTQIVDGLPLKEWVCSKNVFPDFTLENHNFWDLPYQFNFLMLGRAELAYRAIGRPSPEAFTFRIPRIWEDIQAPLSLDDGGLLDPQGFDWGWRDYQHLQHYAWLATLRGIGSAGAFENQALGIVLKRQLAIGTGEMQALDFGYQTMLVSRWAFAELMHRYAPIENPISAREAETHTRGVWIYPHVKTAIHRASGKVVSVSWGPGSQAVQVIPQGEGIESPFFVVAERGSGNASVKVTVDGNALPMQVSPASVRRENGGMRVSYHRSWGDAVTQFITVVSFPSNATLYLSAFRAERDAEVELGPLFPQRVAQLPGLASPIASYRGGNWLNFGNRIGYVSASSLPKELPENRFLLSEARKLTVTKGKWFGEAAVVVYTNQAHRESADAARALRVSEVRPGCVDLAVPSSAGIISLSIDLLDSGR